MKSRDRAGRKGEKRQVLDAISLILFVHLAVASDADKALAATGLSRTHHRILFLIAMRPGVTAGEIVTLLRVTAQAIQAPLRALIDNGLIQQYSSESDKRRRHLTLTERGQTFLEALSNAQHERIANALAVSGEEGNRSFVHIMQAMMDENDRQWLYPSDKSAAPVPRLHIRNTRPIKD